MKASPSQAFGALSPLVILVVGFSLVALLGVVLYHYTRSNDQPAAPGADSQRPAAAAPSTPQGHTPWEQLWSRALAQPVLGCREAPGANTFVTCVCPDMRPQVAVAQCQPEPGWPEHRLIGALQALLRVGQPELVWVDWELGPQLSQALQQLPCNLPEEAGAARTTIVNADPGENQGTVISTATKDAALQLLMYLKQNPACAA